VFRIVVSSDSMKKATATSHAAAERLESFTTAGTSGMLLAAHKSPHDKRNYPRSNHVNH
jgi:hypothetical protein